MMKKLFTGLLFLFIALPAFASDYIIGDGDVLQVSVWGNPELSVQVTVRPDGKITIPAVGDVQATGFTPVNLGKEVTRVLDRLVKGPTVTLNVVQMTNNRVYVSGGGVPSEIVTLPGRTTLFKFLCRFGDLRGVDLQNGYLMRDGAKVDVDFVRLFLDGDFSRDIDLRRDDILFLPPNDRNKIYVLGAVKAPRFIYYRPGITVLDSILEAEGFSDHAKERNVAVLRRSGERVRVNVRDITRGRDPHQNLTLEPGDYVIVEESFF
jgi:polysaccharide biosynthesis/export protein